MARPTRTTALASLALAGALALTACSGTGADEGDMDHGGDHAATEGGAADLPDGVNEADVTFAQQMLPHHEQAIEMADLALAHADLEPEVAALAQQIKDAQGPEIETLEGWLSAWGVEPAEGEMDHGGHDGMMSEEDLEELADAGDDTGRLFLEQMIVHHEGAVAMAQEQVEGGEDADAVALAESIVTTQQEEIDTMRAMLDTLVG